MTIDDFEGYGAPLTARGLSSPYGLHPWHMAGRNLAIWFRPPEGEVARHVPAPLTVPSDSLCRVRFYDLVHNHGFEDDRLCVQDAPRGRFHEAVLAVPAVGYDLDGPVAQWDAPGKERNVAMTTGRLDRDRPRQGRRDQT
jgi:hypothetical protein